MSVTTYGESLETERPSGIWFIILGLVIALCGLFALLAPLASTIALTVIVALAAGLAGVAQIIQSFGTRTWGGFFLNLLLGVIYAACGVFLWFNPLAGALAVSMVLALFLIAAGIGEIALALKIRGESGWVWLLVSGIVALVGGLWLLLRMPTAGFFIPGIALGMALVFEGGAFVAIGLQRKPQREAAPASADPASA